MKLLYLALTCLLSTCLHATVIFDIDIAHADQHIVQKITVADTDEQQVVQGNYAFSVSTHLVNESVVAVLKVYAIKPSGKKKLLAQPTMVIEQNEPAELVIDGVIAEKDMKMHVHAVHVLEEN